MSTINIKSTKSVILAAYNDAIRELELVKLQLADVREDYRIAVNDRDRLAQHAEHFEIEAGQALQALEVSNQVRAELQDERNELIAENEAQVAELTTQKGVLMSEVTALKSEVQILKESYDDVESQLIAAEERIAKQGQIIAAQPKSAPPASPKKPAPKPSVPVSAIEAQPVVQITDADKRVWAAFNALPREKRQSYYEFARSTVGHLGIHNIVAVREAFLAAKAA